MSLDKLRREIDGIDEKLVTLLCRRAQIARRIGATKRRQQTPIHNREREGAVLAHVAALYKAPLTGADLRRIFKVIMAVCTRVQKSVDGARGD